MRLKLYLIFTVLFFCISVSATKAEMTLNELVFDDTKPFNLKILEAIPKSGKIQIGSDNAKYTIIEFFDYFCGYCKKIHEELLNITKLREDVRVIFIHYPILNESSVLIAKIAVAANMQGKGFEFHHSIFTMQGSITSKKLEDAIKESDINEVQLKIDMDRKEVEKVIALSSFLAKASGARGTPSIFIDNEFYGGYLSQDKIEKLLE